MKPDTFSYPPSDSIADNNVSEVNEESAFPYKRNLNSDLSKDDVRFRSLIRTNVPRKKASAEILRAIRSSIQSS